MRPSAPCSGQDVDKFAVELLRPPILQQTRVQGLKCPTLQDLEECSAPEPRSMLSVPYMAWIRDGFGIPSGYSPLAPLCLLTSAGYDLLCSALLVSGSND